jgi:hypothetical protein
MYIEHDPEAAAFIHQYVAEGLRRQIARLKQQASAAEAALVVAVGLRPKRIEIPLIKAYIDTYPAFFDWGWMQHYNRRRSEASD